LIVGGFKVKPDDVGEEFGKTIYDSVSRKSKGIQLSGCFRFPRRAPTKQFRLEMRRKPYFNCKRNRLNIEKHLIFHL
jgi:muramoyltetrapeptide carboxypeptidase